VTHQLREALAEHQRVAICVASGGLVVQKVLFTVAEPEG